MSKRKIPYHNYLLEYVDIDRLFLDLVQQTDSDSKIHMDVLAFKDGDFKSMRVDLERCLITTSFIDFSWSDDDDWGVDITYDFDEQCFTEFDKEEID